MIKTLKIKNVAAVELRGLKPGDTLTLPCDENGVALDRYWRNRIRDAEFDNCLEVVSDMPAATIFKENQELKRKKDNA